MNRSKKELLKIAMELVKHKIDRERDGLELRILGCEYLKLKTRCEIEGDDDRLERLETLRSRYADKWRSLEDYKVFIPLGSGPIILSTLASVTGYLCIGLIDEIDVDLETPGTVNRALEIIITALRNHEVVKNESRRKRLETMKAYRRRKKLATTAA